MTRTFLDSGVLIAAARGTDELHLRALDILDDPEREFITSDYVRLEVIPNAVFHRKEAERKFYEAFFDHAVATVHPSPELVRIAEREASKACLSATDALHVAAAMEADAQELITHEKPTKPFFRVTDIVVTSLRQ